MSQLSRIPRTMPACLIIIDVDVRNLIGCILTCHFPRHPIGALMTSTMFAYDIPIPDLDDLCSKIIILASAVCQCGNIVFEHFHCVLITFIVLKLVHTVHSISNMYTHQFSGWPFFIRLVAQKYVWKHHGARILSLHYIWNINHFSH